MTALQAGARVILRMKPPLHEACRLIDRFQVTQYAMLASDLLEFVEYAEQHPTRLPSLRNCLGSGDAVPHELHQRFLDLFGWPVMEGCGMTEVGGYYAMNPRRGPRKWGSLGLPAPATELRIQCADNEPAGTGTVGEILVRSPSVTTGYWDDDQATAELFDDGWLRTGDLGRLDEDGFVWFTGRRKLMIVRRGSNIAPAEIEDVIDDHPGVHASVVVGVPDHRDGHVPVAFVACIDRNHPVPESELRTFVHARIADFKNPVAWFYLDELPRNATGKFDRHCLAVLATERMAAPGK